MSVSRAKPSNRKTNISYLVHVSKLFLLHIDSAEVHPWVHSFLVVGVADLVRKDPEYEMGLRTGFGQAVVLLEGDRPAEALASLEACSFANDADRKGAGLHRGPCDPFWKSFKVD